MLQASLLDYDGLCRLLCTSRIGWLLRDTALILVANHTDVAVLAPAGAPRVLHEPIVFAFSAVANHKHTVIQVCSTSRVVKNSTAVELESALVCLNRNRDRLLGHRLLQRGLIS